MGNRIRVLVSGLLALICLSVLSLHVALCLRYPSPLFAVTLLLNPSLWLFLGLMSMLCTILIEFRDQRRKLVPALCSTCRPKHESAPLIRKYAESRRCSPGLHEDLSCYCSKRFMSTSQYQSDSSVQIVTHTINPDSDSQQVVTKVGNTKASFTSAENSHNSQSIVSHTSEDKDVQNFSCLMFNQKENNETFSHSSKDVERAGSFNHKKGRLAYCSYNSNQYRLYATNRHLATNFSSENQFRSHEAPNVVGSESELMEDRLIDLSEDYVNESTDPAFSRISRVTVSVPSSSGAIRKQRSLLNNKSGRTTRFVNSSSTCTCPVRYYLKYNTRGQVISKSKPIMKCSLIHKTKTPVHLFEVKHSPTLQEDDSKESEVEVKTELPELETANPEPNCLDLSYDSLSCSSLTPLVPNSFA